MRRTAIVLLISVFRSASAFFRMRYPLIQSGDAPSIAFPSVKDSRSSFTVVSYCGFTPTRRCATVFVQRRRVSLHVTASLLCTSVFSSNIFSFCNGLWGEDITCTTCVVLALLPRLHEHCRPHPPLLQDAQGPPEPGLWQPVRTRQPPDHPKHATASHQSYRVYRADADPWAKWGSQTSRRQVSAGGRLKVLQPQNTGRCASKSLEA
jgi:hypothetical protein